MEKRFYQRLNVNIAGNFIVNESVPETNEFDGVIQDISEDGIRFSVMEVAFKKILREIAVGSNIVFQALDEYNLFGEKRTDVFSGSAEVKRVRKEGNSYEIGCIIVKTSKEYDEYIKYKKMANFVNCGFQMY